MSDDTTQYGRGKYDDECEAIAFELGLPAGVVLLVLGGPRGSGFSTVFRADQGEATIKQLPRLLREIADGIEKSIEREGLVPQPIVQAHKERP